MLGTGIERRFGRVGIGWIVSGAYPIYSGPVPTNGSSVGGKPTLNLDLRPTSPLDDDDEPQLPAKPTTPAKPVDRESDHYGSRLGLRIKLSHHWSFDMSTGITVFDGELGDSVYATDATPLQINYRIAQFSVFGGVILRASQPNITLPSQPTYKVGLSFTL